MRVRQLEAFVVVAEELHFGRAAERLHISQPALSRQIDQLERELDVQLLRRDRRRVELTEAGAAYRDGLSVAITQLGVAARIARRVSAGSVGQLRIGHADSASQELVGAALRRFRQAHPGAGASVVELGSDGIADGLLERRLDVGLVSATVAHKDLRDVLLREEPFVVALPSGHRAAAAPAVDLRALADDHLVVVLRRSEPVLHDLVLAICRDAGFSPSGSYQAAPLSSALPIVAGGLACAIVPLGMSRLMSLPGVTYRPIDGLRRSLEVRVAWRREDGSPLVATMVAALQEHSAGDDLG